METWLPVPGYEGLYEVSDAGRLKSMRRTGTRGGIKKTPPDAAGYPQASLGNGSRQVTARIHQLVALTFLGPCPPGMEVRHLDGNPANNARVNLAYGTSAENKIDTVDHGTHWGARKTRCKHGHEFTPANTRIRSRGNGRDCRACGNARSAKYYAQRQATKKDSMSHQVAP